MAFKKKVKVEEVVEQVVPSTKVIFHGEEFEGEFSTVNGRDVVDVTIDGVTFRGNMVDGKAEF